jgi:ATPase subunit of ABC transporter with duplicated ATPase domains
MVNANFRLLKGEHIGLVGANGEGKSTFLNIITGNLLPDSGKIEWAKNIKVGYLDQYSTLSKGKTIRDVCREAFDYLFDLEARMYKLYEDLSTAEGAAYDAAMEEIGDIGGMLDASGFYNIDTKIDQVAAGLGLVDLGMDRDVTELSGGQRSKVLLTKLLLQNPGILILDEPTNFLDENHILWLRTFLQNYQNAFILVSHDVEFLNDCVNVIYHIEDAALTRYSCDYYKFVEMIELKKKQQNAAYEKQQKEIAGMEDFIARNKARVATRNLAASRQKKLDKMEMIEQVTEKPKPTFVFQTSRTPGRVIFEAKDLIIGYDEALTVPINVILERNKKIAVRGVNGIGKSTLLKTLIGKIKPFGGEVTSDPFIDVGYFEQEETTSIDKTALEEISDLFPRLSIGEVRSALANCGLTRMHIETKVRVLSGGENAKVRMCRITLAKTNVLVLDEPTNHLDVDAKEALKTALRDYKGTILLVSHDPFFYEDIVDEIWDAEKWTLKIV